MRAHHYAFAHLVLPSILWEGDSMLGILANPENREYLHEIWNGIPTMSQFKGMCARHTWQMREYERAGKTLMPGLIPEKPETYCRILSSDGLSYRSHWIGGEHLVILISLPAPEAQTEAHFVAITTSPDIQYLTLEKGNPEDGNASTVFGAWTMDGRHHNLGEGPLPTADRFLARVCAHLDVPETIEVPTTEQIFGMSKQTTIIAYTPEPLPQPHEHHVKQWEQAADLAFETNDLQSAERLYRQSLEFRLHGQGPHNTIATLATRPLVETLNLLERYQEAEDLCRRWWRQCKRFRMIGHQETLIAIRALSSCLKLQGRYDEALTLMQYRVQLAGLARGKDSRNFKSAQSDLRQYESQRR